MKRTSSIVLVVLVVACFSIYQMSPPVPQRHLVVAVPAFHSSLLPIIASKKDFFLEQGLDVELQVVEYGAIAIELLKQGKVDYAVGYTTPVVLALAEGFDFKILTQLHRAANNTFLVFRKSEGIQNFEDLKDHRVGVIKNTNAEFFLNLLVQLNYLERKDIQVQYFEGEQHIKALVDGSVDAIVAWHPRGDEVVANNKSDFGIITSPLYSDFSILVTSNQTAAKNSKEIKLMLQALIEAQSFFDHNKEESYAITLSEIGHASTSENHSRWNDTSFIVEITNVFYSMLEAELDWAFERQNNMGPSPDAFLDLGPLKGVAPDRVLLE